ESTLRNNTTAFDAVHLMPSMLTDLGNLDTSATVLGQKVEWPVIMAPTGINRLFHHDGERAVARAAAKAGTLYSLSTMSNVSIEEIGGLTSGPKCFQIYIHRDRGLTREFVDRCKAARFNALCLTVDTLVAGNRERDLRTGMIMPPRLTMRSLASFATHWRWAYNYLTTEKFELANLANNKRAGAEKLISVIDYVNSQFDPSITWADAEELIAQWDGPFAFKGIMTADDARRAVDIGATAIMVSNHGGRQLDGAPSPFECIAEIADAVDGRAEVILDGGVRRGSHVLKAIAMGATACSIGRGYLYPLAAGGEAGVTRALSRLRAEIERDMTLMGCDRLSKLDRNCLRAAGLSLENRPADRAAITRAVA
ncbi:MAG: alpha-hydroxy-acid oxidizing protein, partial [Alphaproteobacteria bacterium]|nr:alpha-hydroxy-acid oxidizing protein [Alphaproteobacteria bacterium]